MPSPNELQRRGSNYLQRVHDLPRKRRGRQKLKLRDLPRKRGERMTDRLDWLSCEENRPKKSKIERPRSAECGTK